jgi:hypothetical protein
MGEWKYGSTIWTSTVDGGVTSFTPRSLYALRKRQTLYPLDGSQNLSGRYGVKFCTCWDSNPSLETVVLRYTDWVLPTPQLCERGLYHYDYEISAYYSNKLSSVNTLSNHYLCRSSRMSEQSFLSLYRVYSLLNNILIWMCSILYRVRQLPYKNGG